MKSQQHNFAQQVGPQLSQRRGRTANHAHRTQLSLVLYIMIRTEDDMNRNVRESQSLTQFFS
jgi:hypothetical protein